MLLIGMGLIGTLSSNIAEKLMTIGRSDEKLKKVKADNQYRFETFKMVLDKCHLTLNPLIGCVLPIFFRNKLEETEPQVTEHTHNTNTRREKDNKRSMVSVFDFKQSQSETNKGSYCCLIMSRMVIS